MHQWDHEQIWLKAQAYIDRAHAQEPGSREFPFWLALGLELLARSALTKIHPVLNADPRSDVNILYACGFEVAGQPTSLPAHSVYLRLEKTISGFGPTQRELCDYLALLRNQELHTAALPFDTMGAARWLPRFYEVCKILCDGMGRNLTDLLGKEGAEQAQRYISTLEKEVQADVLGRIGTHRALFHAKSEEERAELVSDARSALKQITFGKSRAACPACSTEGVLSGDPVRESIPIYVDEVLSVRLDFVASGFECFACGLRLRRLEEVVAAGMQSRFSDERVTELHELYEADWMYEYDNM